MILRILLLSTVLFIAGHRAKPRGPLFRIIQNGKVGYINRAGDVVIPAKYASGQDFNEGLAAVRENGLYGFINEYGTYVIEPQYEYAVCFNNGIGRVFKDGQPLFIDMKGKVIIDTAFKSLEPVSDRLFVVGTRTSRLGLLEINSQRLIADTVYSRIANWSSGVAVVTRPKTGSKYRGDEYAVMDTSGRFIVPFGRYRSIDDFNEGYAIVAMRDPVDSSYLLGAIDRAGKLLFTKSTEDKSFLRSTFTNGLAVINLYKYWLPEDEASYYTDKTYEGFINLKGDVVLSDTLCKQAISFSSGRAFLSDANSRVYRMVNSHFKQIGKDFYTNIAGTGFHNGYTIVQKGKRWGIVDTNGRFTAAPHSAEIHYTGVQSNYFFYGIVNDRGVLVWGLADVKGNILTKPAMQDFDQSAFVNRLLRAIIDDRLTYIDEHGRIVWQEVNHNNRLREMNVDFMNRAYFDAKSESDRSDLGGFALSSNMAKVIENESQFIAKGLSVLVSPSYIDTFESNYKGYTVSVVNATKTTMRFYAQNSRLNMIVEARNPQGVWCPIEYIPRSRCGNSYHILSLAPGMYWSFVTPAYVGSFTTKLRIALTYIDPTDQSERHWGKKEITVYSNEYDGSVNPAQFWNKMPYRRIGIMDPYID